MYENSATGMKKASHERMLNNQGRKIIKERVGDSNFNSYDHFKNMTSNDANNFDSNWNHVAQQLGFRANTNALEYGCSQNYNQRQRGGHADAQAEARGLGMPTSQARGLGHVDDSRRGHYIPTNVRGEN